MDPYGPKPASVRQVAADPVLPLARLTALGVTEDQQAVILGTWLAMDDAGRRDAAAAMAAASDAGLLAQLGLTAAVVGGSLQGTPDGAGKARKAAKKTAAKKAAVRG